MGKTAQELELTVLVDIAENEIHPGDLVFYPQMSGRSVQMVLARYHGTINGKARLERLEGARWSSAYTRSSYVDDRTGKEIRLWTYSGEPNEHWEKPPCTVFVHRDTDEEISREEFYSIPVFSRGPAEDSKFYNYERQYRPGQLKAYVVKIEKPAALVTITNTQNIVKATVPEETND